MVMFIARFRTESRGGDVQMGVCCGIGLSTVPAVRLRPENWDLGDSVRIVRGLSVRLIVIGISYFVWLHFALHSAFLFLIILYFKSRDALSRALSLTHWARCVSELSLCCFVVIAGFAFAGFFRRLKRGFRVLSWAQFLRGIWQNFHRSFTHGKAAVGRLTYSVFSLAFRSFTFTLLCTWRRTHTNTGWLAGFCCYLAFNPWTSPRIREVQYLSFSTSSVISILLVYHTQRVPVVGNTNNKSSRSALTTVSFEDRTQSERCICISWMRHASQANNFIRRARAAVSLSHSLLPSGRLCALFCACVRGRHSTHNTDALPTLTRSLVSCAAILVWERSLRGLL